MDISYEVSLYAFHVHIENDVPQNVLSEVIKSSLSSFVKLCCFASGLKTVDPQALIETFASFEIRCTVLNPMLLASPATSYHLAALEHAPVSDCALCLKY